MPNLFDIPVYYISFERNQDLEHKLSKQGFKHINHFKAINGHILDPKDLLNNDVISIRSYNDLVEGRTQDMGLPSLGAIGCSLSHLEIWKKCVEQDLPYVVVVEDDMEFRNGGMNSYDMNYISEAISKENGLFISNDIEKDKKIKCAGTELYFASNGACKTLISEFYPVDIQVDCYISHLSNLGKINAKGYKITRQNRSIYNSNIQNICVRCILSKFAYAISSLLILVALYLIWTRCNCSCKIKK